MTTDPLPHDRQEPGPRPSPRPVPSHRDGYVLIHARGDVLTLACCTRCGGVVGDEDQHDTVCPRT